MSSLVAKTCPLCGMGPYPEWKDKHELVNEYVSGESYAGKWVDIDFPVDVKLYYASIMKAEAIAIAKFINKRYEDSGVRFDLGRLGELRIKT